MEQDRDIERGDPIEQRHELRIVQRASLHVGVDLHTDKAQLADSSIELRDRSVDVVQRHACSGAGEPVGKSGHEGRHLVVRDARELERLRGPRKLLDGRICRVDDLHVSVAGDVHRSETCVQIEQRGDGAFLILQTHLWGRNLESCVAVPRGDDVIEDVDLHSRQ